jgi:CubicO group peptidase (beta-lactamase class C family)
MVKPVSNFSVPVASTTIFKVTSGTKTVTAVAVMKLVETGKLKLDDSAVCRMTGLGRSTIY